jgi:hypothetical protein
MVVVIRIPATPTEHQVSNLPGLPGFREPSPRRNYVMPNPDLSFAGPGSADATLTEDEPNFPTIEGHSELDVDPSVDDPYAGLLDSGGSLLSEYEGVAALTAEAPSDGVADLDELLAESLDQVREERAVKATRQRVRKSGWTGVDPADAERIRRWELANEWLAVANVALFHRYRCINCSRQQTVFGQLMLRQEHRHLRNTQRWQRTDTNRADLPSEVVVQKWVTPMCTECAYLAGFEMGKGKVTEWKGNCCEE